MERLYYTLNTKIYFLGVSELRLKAAALEQTN